MDRPCKDGDGKILAQLGSAQNQNDAYGGQLSTYLRPMGAKVPSIYGASGDSLP